MYFRNSPNTIEFDFNIEGYPFSTTLRKSVTHDINWTGDIVNILFDITYGSV